MQLCHKWGQGQVFAFSGIEGPTDFHHGLCGYLAGDRVGIAFRYPCRCDLFVSGASYRALRFTAVTGDYIEALVDEKPLSFLAADAYTVVGVCPEHVRLVVCDGESDGSHPVVLCRQNGRFAFACGTTNEQARQRAEQGLCVDLTALTNRKRAYFDRACPCDDYKDLYAKCLSVMKTQVCTAEGALPGRWSTPERFPHRYAWLWDSCFHAIGFRHIDGALAQELLEAVFARQGEDGFLPHMTGPDWCSAITQPPVVAYAARKVYDITKDDAFLERVYRKNGRFLNWCDANRRVGKLPLYTWHRSEDVHCRCDESGMDNSTRFDTASRLYAIDFSCFCANEMRHMSAIARQLGHTGEAAVYRERYEQIKAAVNRVLWNQKTGLYTDYDIDEDRFHNVLSVASFLPLTAGICDRERAEKAVEALTDPAQFGTPLPIPSLPRGSAYFGDDMWRGPVWINYNYLIAEGLCDYGYTALARSIREKTLATVARYYRRFGTYYEFYDSCDDTPPFLLPRKGPVSEPYDPTVKLQTIRDYGWTGTLVFDWLNTRNEG